MQLEYNSEIKHSRKLAHSLHSCAKHSLVPHSCYINNYYTFQADTAFLRGPHTVYSGREGLETSILGLEFRVKPKHFRRGDMKLKCLATIATVYWRSNEESVEGDKPQKAPVLESRETVPPSKSRADRVQGNLYLFRFCLKILSSIHKPSF